MFPAAELFVPGSIVPSGTVDLGLGYPDLSAFPDHLLDLAMLGHDDQRAAALSYGPADGNLRLVDALHRTLLAGDVGPGRTVITNGAMDGITLVLDAAVGRGGVVVAEDPTFPGLLPVAARLGIRVVGLPVDEDGLDPDHLEHELDRLRAEGAPARVLYTMPTYANPSGTVLSHERRQAVVDLADRRGLLIVEDDAYRAICLGDAPPPTLHSLLPSHVVHIRSLSKALCPGLRLAAVVAPERQAEAIRAHKPVGGTSPLVSELTATVLERLDWDEHQRLLRRLYTDRRDAMVAAVQRHLPDAAFRVPSGGFFLWAELPDELGLDDLHVRAAAYGVRYLPGPSFAVGADLRRWLRLSFSFEAPDRIDEGIARLAASRAIRT